MSTEVRELIEKELECDAVNLDVTGGLIEENPLCRSVVIAKEAGILCGEVVCKAFQEAVRDCLIRCLLSDSTPFLKQTPLVEIRGRAKLCLAIERALLNFIAHLCGISTLTRQFVDRVSPYPVRILATRKTLPGLRDLQLIAVQAGGGAIHRRSLADGILIKDNHQRLVATSTLLCRARKNRSPLHRIEVEVENLEALETLLEHPPDIILLDNMGLTTLEKAVKMIRSTGAASVANDSPPTLPQIEVSGGVTLENVRAIAELGVDYISVGAITHSVRSIDMSLELHVE